MASHQTSTRLCMGLLLFLMTAIGVGAQNDGWLDDNVRLKGGEQTLEAALAQLSEQGVNISYRNDQLPNQYIQIRSRRQAIRAWLNQILQATELTYLAIGEDRSVVIFPDPEIVNQDFSLRGTVFDGNSGERLIMANLFVKELHRGVSSNEFGLYALKLPGGRIRLEISYVGYRKASFDLVLRSDTILDIRLFPDLNLQQIVVTANTDSLFGINPDAGGIPIGMTEVEQLSGLGGENDPLQVVSLLPGIATGADGIGGVNIRGSDASQNLILLDGVPVYNLNHVGLFSIFNSQAIRRVDLYKNGLPARFGGRLAGVLDVHTRDGNLYHNELRLSQSLLATRLTAEGPLVEGESAFLASGRYFGSAALIPKLSRRYKANRGRTGEARYSLYDLNFKINNRIGEKDHIYFSFYKGIDDLENSGERRFDVIVLGGVGTIFNYEIFQRNTLNISWDNEVGALRWNHIFNDRLFGNLSLTYSNLKLRAGGIRQDSLIEAETNVVLGSSSTQFFSSDIRQIGLAFDGQWLPTVGHEIRFGGQFNLHRFQPLLLASNTVDLYSTDFSVPPPSRHQPKELVAYLAYVFRTPESQIRFGIRSQYWRTNDKGTHFVFSPRLFYSRKLSDHLSWQTTLDVTSQAVHLLRNTTIGLPTDIWVPSTKKVSPSQAYQFSSALRFKIGKSWASEVAIYAKEMENLIEYLNEPNLSGDWEDQISVGSGRAYGGEFSLRRERGKIRGWVAYTLAKTERTFGEKVNFGKTFPFRYDRLHSISALVSWHPNTRSSLSFSWRFGTGAAYNFNLNGYQLPIPVDPDNPDRFRSIVTLRNGFRLPPMHRLDINYRLRLPAPANASYTHTFDIGLYNAYDRHNEIYYDLRTDYERVLDELRANRSFVKVFIAPVLPIFSYQIHFKGKRKNNFDL